MSISKAQRRSRVTGFDVSGNLLKLCLALFLTVAPTPALLAQQSSQSATEAPVTDKSDRAAPFTPRDHFRFYQADDLYAVSLSWDRSREQPSPSGLRGNPPEWGQGFPGYGRRLLSGYSRQVIANTVALGVSFAAREDPRHYPTGEHGIWKRSMYAARQAVVSHNASGGLMPAYSRIIGVYAAGFASNAWYPAPYSNVHSALYRGTTALVSDIVWQEFKEFWPDARRRLRRK